MVSYEPTDITARGEVYALKWYRYSPATGDRDQGTDGLMPPQVPNTIVAGTEWTIDPNCMSEWPRTCTRGWHVVPFNMRGIRTWAPGGSKKYMKLWVVQVRGARDVGNYKAAFREMRRAWAVHDSWWKDISDPEHSLPWKSGGNRPAKQILHIFGADIEVGAIVFANGLTWDNTKYPFFMRRVR